MKDGSFNMVLEQLDIYMPTSEPQPHTFYENELKIHHSPKGRINTALLLQENIGENLCDLALGKEFLDVTPKAWPIKEKKTDKMGFMKVKNVALQKTVLRE